MNKKLFFTSCVLTFFALIALLGGLYLVSINKSNPKKSEKIETEQPSRKERFKNVTSWMYSQKLSKNDTSLLAASSFDMMVLDPDTVSKEDLSTIRGDKDPLILSYLHITNAENNRSYWQKDWKSNTVDWINREDSKKKGTFIINFWSEEWKNILNSYIDQLLDQGFDGFFFDIKGFEYWKTSDDISNPETYLVQCIKALSEHIQSNNNDAIIIVDDISLLNAKFSEQLVSSIDGVSQEGVFYGYDQNDGVETQDSITADYLKILDAYKTVGMSVFTREYPFNCEKETTCYDQMQQEILLNLEKKTSEAGLISYTLFSKAEGISWQTPKIIKTDNVFDTVPVLRWEVVSPNDASPQNAYRIFVSSTQERLQSDNADIYDSGKLWTSMNSFGFIPNTTIQEGTYWWKVVAYDYVEGVSLLSRWSDISELTYKKPFSPKPLVQTEVTQTAWIPSWGFEDGFTSLKQNKEYFKQISPVWHVVHEDGTLTSDGFYNNSDFLAFCTKNDIAVLPSLQLFTSEELSTILHEHLDSHVENILKEVEDGNYQGIDIDYESTFLADKELFFTFLEHLSSKLHEAEKVLSVTVLSKWTDQLVYGFLPETRQVQDWERIGKLADEVRIMAYDYTAQNSYIPGSISPIYWDELIINYALTKLPRQKIVLALPLYAYSFRIDEHSTISQDIFTGGEPAGSEKRVLAYSYEDIKAIQNDFDFLISYDKTTMDRVISYNDGTYDRVLYYTDALGIQSRKSLAYEYGIKGVAYWRLGADDGRSFE